MRRTSILVLGFLLALVPAAPAAQQPDPSDTLGVPGVAPLVSITRATGPIRVDGVLDDEGWANAVRVSGFTEFAPRENAAPPAETEVLLAYDDRYLYVGFIAHGDPTEVRASWSNRDVIWNDDHVGIIIDPYGEASTGFFLLANPYGVQADLLFTATGDEDVGWDAIFESRGRITDDAYVVEMAIPFRSLRFPDRPVHTWRVNFYRNMPRTNRHQIAWAPISQDNPCLLCQNGTLTGLAGVRPGGGLELLPAVVASRAGRLADNADRGSFADDSPRGEASLGAKYSFAAGWTLEGTLNPDFSQVESDAAQIDVNTTFALFYPERRPFFQEGSDLYGTWLNVFYSRSVNAPEVAAKLTGRSGRTRVGYLAARDRLTPFLLPFEERSAFVEAGRSVSNVLRVRHDLPGGSYIGGMLTDRRLDGGGSGSGLSLDALYRFRGVYQLQAQWVGSHTREPDDATLTDHLPELRFGRGDRSYTAAFDGETFSGASAHLRLSRSARLWSYNVGYAEATPTYRADTGFQTRNDFRRVTGSTDLTFRPQRFGIERIAPSLGGGSIWNFEGEHKDVWLRSGLYVLLPWQTNLSVNGLVSREVFRDVEFDGIRRWSVSLNTTPSAALQAGIWFEQGRGIARNVQVPVLGDALDGSVWVDVRPLDRLRISPSVSFGRLRSRESGEEFFHGYIGRVRADYQFSRELSLRLVTQYNGFSENVDVEPLLVYRLNPFSIFYIGSTHGYREFDGYGWSGTDRQFFLKFQYLFQM